LLRSPLSRKPLGHGIDLFPKGEAMKRILLALVPFLLAAVANAAEPVYSLDVDVSATSQPNVYMCRATLTDLANGNTLFAPSIQLRAGSPATASGQDGDFISEFQVSVDPESSRVTTEVKVTRGGKLVARQKSSVAVR
jgi:hypothetical protein